jgi:ADP-heptose:LPS heptosyltransferase
MDSAVLQIAMALRTPVVSIFAGVEPHYRVLPNQNARVLVSSISCRPCNKKETCKGMYHCINSISANDVLNAMRGIEDVRGLEVVKTPL